MSSADEKHVQPRPERERGRSNRTAAIIISLLLVLANSVRLVRYGQWGVLLPVGVILVLVYLWSKRINGDIKTLRSRTELSEAVSRAHGMRRINLVWYEYVIARNVARGTYQDEPPIEFKSDAYDASMRMGMATRYSMRQLVWFCSFMLAVAVGTSFLMSAGDVVFALIMSAGMIVMVGVIVGITLLFVWWSSRKPLSQLGRRIEDAAELESGPRWQQLLLIANDEAMHERSV